MIGEIAAVLNWLHSGASGQPDRCRDERVCGAWGRKIVLTTTNKKRLEELVGPTDAFEIVGKPYDLKNSCRP